MFDINDRNKMFAYVPSKSDLTVDNINLYSNSLIFIGDENQIYQPLTNTYIGIGLTAYNNLSNDVKAKIDKLYIYNQLNDDNIYYFPVLKTPSTGSFYYTYTSNRIGFNPYKQLFIGNLSGTSYTSSYSYIYPNSNDKNLPLIFADVTNNINNTIYKGAGNFIFYNPAKGSFGLGNNIVASGNYSTTQGINNMSYGDYSHVGGSQSISYGESSFVHGTGLLVGSYSNVVAFGKWNDARHEDSVFMIGNGVDNENRSNLFEIRDNGCAYAETFVGNLNGRARWADYATYSTYTTYTTYALYNSYQSVHNISSNKNYYITFSEHSTYSLSYIDTDFYYNPYTNVLNSPKFSGNLTGDVTGNLTGNVTGNLTGDVTGNLTGDVTGNVTGNLTGDVTGNVSGNAGTATKLQTARKINGTSFDGTADITIKPKVLIEGKQTAVQVGNQTSPYIVLAYSQTADLADRATKLNTSRSINGTNFDGTANITIAPTLPINGNTVAVKVGNQQSSYVTIPYATNSNLAAKATKLETSRKINGTSFDGTADITIAPKVLIEGKQVAVQVGNQTSPYVAISYSYTADLASRATKLDNSRTFNGESFNGTANVTMATSLPISGNTIAVKVGNQQSSFITVPYATNSNLSAKATKLETSRKINGTSFDGTADINIKPKVLIEGKQLGVQVGNQTSDYITVSYSYTADLAARATKLDNARTFNGESFNGTANVTMATSLPISGNTVAVKVGNQTSPYITIPYATNSNLAAKATKLETSRKINGTSFDGTADINIKPKVLIEGKQLSVQVGNQTSDYITVSYSYTTDLSNRATKLNSARSINGTNFDGTANITIAPTLPISGNTVAVKVGNQTSPYITIPYATTSGSTTGNAATATKLQTARKINGTSFDGTADITIAPKVLIEGKQVAVQVGNQTSPYVAISYSYTADLASRATKLNSARSINGTNFDGTANITIAPTLPISGNTVAVKVGNQTSPYITVPYATTSGSTTGNAATATKLQTARKINGTSFDGSADITIAPKLLIEGKQVAVQVGNQTSPYIAISYSHTADLADRATKLNTARSINGTNFDGTANITIAPSLPINGNKIAVKVGNQQSGDITVPYATTSGSTTGNAATATKWQTARTLTIGSTGKSVDGSANVSWTLDEIGVYSKTTSDSRFVNATGDTMTGTLTLKGSTSENMTFANNVHPALRFDNSNSSQNIAFIFTDYDTYRSPAGIKLIGNQGSEWFEAAGEMYAAGGKKVLHAGNYTDYTVTKTGSGASGSWGISITGNAATATKWQTTRTFTIGSTGKSVDGTANVSWSLDEIGVYSKTASDDRYVNVTGDTMTGHLKMKGTKNLASSWDPGVIAGADGHDKVVLTYLASSTNGATIGAHNSNLSAWALLNVSGTQLVFRINETEKMRLNASGYLGIGTSSPSYPLHVNGNAYASGFIKSGSSSSYVLTGDGGHKEWNEGYKVSTIVARNSSGQIYCSHLNTTSNDMNTTNFTKVFVSNDNWVRYVTKAKFMEAVNGYDTVSITKSLKVTEAWMDTGIVMSTANFPRGSGTYAIKISHGTLNSGTDGYASIYSGIISIYTDGTNSTTDCEEVILHRAGHAWANRIYIRTMPVASSGNCKLQIATSKTWSAAQNITFTFRKLV